jgi:hypothetical protein
VCGELGKPHHAHIVQEAVVEAQKLMKDEVDGAKGRDIGAVAVDIMVPPRSPHLSLYTFASQS